MAPPHTIDYEALFREAVEQVQNGANEVIKGFNSLVLTVNDAIEKFTWGGLIAPWSPAVAAWLQYNMGEIRARVMDVLDVVRTVLERYTPVLSLIIASFRWIGEVQTPLSDLSSVVKNPRDQNLYQWTGAAASAYHDKAGGQQAAVNQTSSHAAYISDWLFSIAQSNVDFAVEVSKLLTKLTGKLIAAAAETGAVVTLPWAIQQLSEMISDLVTGFLDLLVEIGRRFMEALGNVRDLSSEAGDHSALPGGKWPEAVIG